MALWPVGDDRLLDKGAVNMAAGGWQEMTEKLKSSQAEPVGCNVGLLKVLVVF
ncbi:MAG: hypothetical protein AB1Y25_06065 [Cycloclasticus sp.]